MHRFRESDLAIESRLILLLASPAKMPLEAGDLFARCNWARLLQTAGRHHLLSMLAIKIPQICGPGQIPEPFATKLSNIRKAAIITAHRQMQALSGFLEDLHRDRIPIMLLKGQGLAERLYDDSAERESVDLDLLVRRSDMDRAGKILKSRGYTALQPELFQKSHFHIPYVSMDHFRPSIIELHWDVTFKDSSINFDIDTWWDGAIRADLQSGSVLLPPREEEIVYTSYHGMNRGVLMLRDLLDIARLRLYQPEEICWERVWTVAEKSGVLSFVSVVHQLCESLWPIPSVALPQLLVANNWRLRIAANLISPSTILEAGKETWWPYKRILYWATMPGDSSRESGLFSRTNQFLNDLHDTTSEHSLQKSTFLTAPRVLIGLLCCLLPLPWFPATREAFLLGEWKETRT